MKITNEIKSKILKAAWTMFRKSNKIKKFSTALRNAWAWGKKELTREYKVWTPNNTRMHLTKLARVYFGESYIQITVSERERKNLINSNYKYFATGYYKLVNVTEEKFNEYAEKICKAMCVENLLPWKF